MNTDEFEGHTPGPWKAHNELYKNGIDENNLGEVSSFRKTWGVTLSEERLDDWRASRIGHHVMHIADAKLIAAAPLLLDMLNELLEECRMHYWCYESENDDDVCARCGGNNEHKEWCDL